MPRDFCSAHEEIRFFERNPHVKNPYGYQTTVDICDEELEFLAQDKSKTLEYKIAHELLPEEKGSLPD